jgi:succinoglycan biosynthesis transport protein ExoP
MVPEVPNEASQSITHNTSERTELGKALPHNAIVEDPTLAATIVTSPLSRFAESIRSVKMAVDLNHVNKSQKVIGITSTLPNEGKSTVALSLAKLIAQTGARTLLLDFDLRKPWLTKMLCPGAKLGTLDVIAGRCRLSEALWTDTATRLALLPTGRKVHLALTNEILASDKLKDFVDSLKQTYEYIIVDLSPLAPVVDVRATTHFIDSYLFVIEWGRTPLGAVEEALNGAPGVYEKTLGVILNKTDMKLLGRYGGYRGGYHYYHKSYAEYRYADEK